MDPTIFASAVVLALIALLIGCESLMRFYSPIAIDFPQAIAVAGIGLGSTSCARGCCAAITPTMVMTTITIMGTDLTIFTAASTPETTICATR